MFFRSNFSLTGNTGVIDEKFIVDVSGIIDSVDFVDQGGAKLVGNNLEYPSISSDGAWSKDFFFVAQINANSASVLRFSTANQNYSLNVNINADVSANVSTQTQSVRELVKTGGSFFWIFLGAIFFLGVVLFRKHIRS